MKATNPAPAGAAWLPDPAAKRPCAAPAKLNSVFIMRYFGDSFPELDRDQQRQRTNLLILLAAVVFLCAIEVGVGIYLLNHAKTHHMTYPPTTPGDIDLANPRSPIPLSGVAVCRVEQWVGAWYDCLVVGQEACPHALSYGDAYFCRHPDRAAMAVRARPTA